MPAFRTLPLLLLMALLSLPSILSLAGLQPASLAEYRAPIPRPATSTYFNADKSDFAGFTAHLEAWYSDRISSRAILIRLYTQLLYSLFRESSQLHIGKDGWLYYRDVIDSQIPILERLDTNFHAEITERLARLSALLEEQDILLYVMPVALKYRYYPENLPASALHAHATGFYDAYMDRLISDGRIRVLDTRKLLENAKISGLKIFHQTDFHWTDPAGALAFRALLEDMAAQEGKLPLLDYWEYETVPYPELSGGQARALPLFKPLSETSVDLQFKGPNVNFELRHGNGFEFAAVSTPMRPENLLPILVYGDSFTEAGIRAGMQNMFQAFLFARNPGDDLVEAYRNREPGTRYLVIEYITSSIFGADDRVTALIRELAQDAGD
jgi:hypothetical protein